MHELWIMRSFGLRTPPRTLETREGLGSLLVAAPSEWGYGSASLWATSHALALCTCSSLHSLVFRGQRAQNHNYLSSIINETYFKWGIFHRIVAKCALFDFISRIEIISQKSWKILKNHDKIMIKSNPYLRYFLNLKKRTIDLGYVVSLSMYKYVGR